MKDIDFKTLDDVPQDDATYKFSMNVYDDQNRACGGCRTKTKDDLKAMYQLWKETYGIFNLRYFFSKNGQVIEL